MSGWRPDSPVELADGTVCCQAHHLVYCAVCCCDYSFMKQSTDSDSDDILDDEQSEDSDADNRAGLADCEIVDQKPIEFTPVMRFVPPNSSDTPEKLFIPKVGFSFSRIVRRTNRLQMLVYTDGACSNNAGTGPVGGCAFVFKGGESLIDQTKATAFRLEDRGPSGIVYPHTSNRAELRAVIGALQFRAWNGEGYNELVIATDSEYVEKGATQWIAGWVKRGWRTSLKKEVANRDLWELFFKEIQQFKECPYRPLRVMIWRIPRALNTVADQAAKEAVARGRAQDEFCPILGVLC